MKHFIFETEAEAAAHAADGAARITSEKPDALFCLAAGHTSLPFFDALIAKKIDFSRARFVELDEWLDLPRTAPGSCAGFLQQHFFSRINARPENICLFDPLAADADAECCRVTAQITAWGGIDYLLLGMGMNGHLALNEPGCNFRGGASVITLSQTTLQVAPKYFNGDMPPLTRGVTLGIADLTAARSIHLLVLGEHKRDVCRRLRSCNGPAPEFPASALLAAEHAELIMDQAAAGRV